MKNNRSNFGGIQIKTIENIPKKFICEYCKLILFNSWQLLCCGRLCCRWCVKKGLSDNEPFVCEYCDTQQAKQEALPDIAVDRELKLVVVSCYACSWEGTYRSYLDHLKEQHADFKCTDCNERFIAVNAVEEHRDELCIYRRLPCGLRSCEDSVKWNEMQEHYLSEQHQRILLSMANECLYPDAYCLETNKQSEIIVQAMFDVHESIDINVTSSDTLSNDVIRLRNEESQIKANVEENHSNMNELEKYKKSNEKNLNELMKLESNVEQDITDISRVLEDEQVQILDLHSTTTLRFSYPTEPQFTMYSPKIMTSPYGYVFKFRLASTVVSEIEYLSICLTFCNGNFNNVIDFPFPYDIYIALWDQLNQRKHIIYQLKPDPASPAFIRPNNNNKEEFSIIKFCLLEYLTDPQSIYVRDEVFFLRIFVDFLHLNKEPFTPNNTDVTVVDNIQNTTT